MVTCPLGFRISTARLASSASGGSSVSRETGASVTATSESGGTTFRRVEWAMRGVGDAVRPSPGGTESSTGIAPGPYTVPIRLDTGGVDKFSSTVGGRASPGIPGEGAGDGSSNRPGCSAVSRETARAAAGSCSSCIPFSCTTQIPSVMDDCASPASPLRTERVHSVRCGRLAPRMTAASYGMGDVRGQPTADEQTKLRGLHRSGLKVDRMPVHHRSNVQTGRAAVCPAVLRAAFVRTTAISLLR